MQHTVSMPGHRNDVASVLSTAPKSRRSTYNDDLLYTPEVVVFKTDIAAPERMEEKDWYQVDIITCAAPNLRKKPSNAMNPSAGNAPVKISEKALYELQMQRLERVFQAAASNGAEVLILGAFGCGAFCNPPRIVARVFRSVQENMHPILKR